ncbi:MAG: hypothetical protein SGILL_008240 [Bacillariaceae sp.]
MFVSIVFALALLAQSAVAFQPIPAVSIQSRAASGLLSKKSEDDEVPQVQALAVGTFVEFEEKKRVHAGKIQEAQHNLKGARYVVVDSDGHQFSIADKEVHFAIHPPTAPKQADQLFNQFVVALHASPEELEKELQINAELLELAWEEALESETDSLTPGKLVELVHSHAASKLEKYKAWRLLQSDLSHVFFKDIKDHGRIKSFKAKARKAVDAAKQHFCNTHDDSDLCLV